MVDLLIYLGWFACGLSCGVALKEKERRTSISFRRHLILAALNGVAAITLALLR